MTVTDLVMNFRDALLALIPCFDAVGMPWRRHEAYDEWDNCAAAVFQALVVEPLRYALPEAEREGFNLPEYDMLLPTYAGLRVVELVPEQPDRTIRVFHAFGTLSRPFDVVEVRAVSQQGLPTADGLETVPLEHARFAIRLYAKDEGRPVT